MEKSSMSKAANNAKAKGLGSFVSKDSDWSRERRENSKISR